MKLVPLVLVAVAAALIGAPLADAHRVNYPSSSSFGYYAGNAVIPDSFLGQVSSRQAACVRGRTAKVFRQRRGRRDVRIGRARTSRTGQWTIEKRRVRRARYYLKITRKNLRSGGRHRHVCKAYRSSTLPMGD